MATGKAQFKPTSTAKSTGGTGRTQSARSAQSAQSAQKKAEEIFREPKAASTGKSGSSQSGSSQSGSAFTGQTKGLYDPRKTVGKVTPPSKGLYDPRKTVGKVTPPSKGLYDPRKTVGKVTPPQPMNQSSRFTGVQNKTDTGPSFFFDRRQMENTTPQNTGRQDTDAEVEELARVAIAKHPNLEEHIEQIGQIIEDMDRREREKGQRKKEEAERIRQAREKEKRDNWANNLFYYRNRSSRELEGRIEGLQKEIQRLEDLGKTSPELAEKIEARKKDIGFWIGGLKRELKGAQAFEYAVEKYEKKRRPKEQGTALNLAGPSAAQGETGAVGLPGQNRPHLAPEQRDIRRVQPMEPEQRLQTQLEGRQERSAPGSAEAQQEIRTNAAQDELTHLEATLNNTQQALEDYLNRGGPVNEKVVAEYEEQIEKLNQQIETVKSSLPQESKPETDWGKLAERAQDVMSIIEYFSGIKDVRELISGRKQAADFMETMSKMVETGNGLQELVNEKGWFLDKPMPEGVNHRPLYDMTQEEVREKNLQDNKQFAENLHKISKFLSDDSAKDQLQSLWDQMSSLLGIESGPDAKTVLRIPVDGDIVDIDSLTVDEELEKLSPGIELEKPHVDNPFGEDGKLLPDVSYTSGEFNYLYETDSYGRICNWSTDSLQITSRTKRLRNASNTPGKQAGDHAGHLAGDVFGGSNQLNNLVSQLSKVNQSDYRKIEIEWQKAIRAGQAVTVNMDILYEGDSQRPTGFALQYSIDGIEYKKEIISNNR